MSRPRSALANLLLLCASLGLVFGGLELLARRWRAHARGALASRYTEFDPLLGWRHRPGARAAFPLGAYAINSRGLRDIERDYAPAPGVARVLVLGDSFAEGYNVHFEDSVSRTLGRALAAEDCRAEAINAGTVGYSTDQEFLFYREELHKYGASVVVLLLHYNDVIYNGRASVGTRPKPLFSFAGGEARLKNVPLEPEPPRAAAAGREAEGSAALEWLKLRLMNASPGTHDALAKLGLWEVLETGEPSLELQVFSREPPQAVEDAWEFTRHILRHLEAEAAAHGARLLVAYVPSKMEVSDRAWALTQARYGVSDASWDRRRLARLVKRAGAELGFPVLDLTQPLQRQDRGFWGGPYHDPGGHWNALGHRIAAEELARALLAERLLSCP